MTKPNKKVTAEQPSPPEPPKQPYSKSVGGESHKVSTEQQEEVVVKSTRCFLCHQHKDTVEECLIAVVIAEQPAVTSRLQVCPDCLKSYNMHEVPAKMRIVKFPISHTHLQYKLSWYQYHALVTRIFDSVDWIKHIWKDNKNPFTAGGIVDKVFMEEGIKVEPIINKTTV